MAEPPELWTFVLANLLVFGFGATLTTLSYYAYRVNGRPSSFRLSTVGFGVLTAGGLVEPVYQLGLKGGDYSVSGRELLAMQSIEGLFVAVGLGLLFYSIYIHNTDAPPHDLTSLDQSADSS
ncbi:MAG: hypothetical protein ABEJ92_03670 [Halobacteriales archaeon]